MRRVTSIDQEVPVLIAGGGLIGLSTAMFLAQNGIPSLAVERLRGGSPLPLTRSRSLERSGDRRRLSRPGRDR